MLRGMWPMVLVILAAPGCSTEGEWGLPHPDASEQVEDPPGIGAQEFDFGAVFAGNQTLRHDFLLRNPTAGRVRLLKATALVPCCSGVEAIPESIPPRGEAIVRVFLKGGDVADRKRVAFEVETDLPGSRSITLAVSATFVLDREVVPAEGPDRLRLGDVGTRTYRVVARRIGTEGRKSPASVEGVGDVRAAFRGPVKEIEQQGGLVESSRLVEVAVPASSQVGRRRGEMVLRWEDGEARRETVEWEVTPWLRASPEGLAVGPSPGPLTHLILIRSVDHPFRVTEVSGPTLAGPVAQGEESREAHLLKVAIDPSRGPAGGRSAITIATDHPRQRAVTVDVLVLPTAKGGSE